MIWKVSLQSSVGKQQHLKIKLFYFSKEEVNFADYFAEQKRARFARRQETLDLLEQSSLLHLRTK